MITPRDLDVRFPRWVIFRMMTICAIGLIWKLLDARMSTKPIIRGAPASKTAKDVNFTMSNFVPELCFEFS